MKVSGISVVLPCFNEEQNVRPVVEQALETLSSIADEFEVIVVDDGSIDATAAVVTELVEDHHPRVRLLRHTRNRGYGSAIRTGLRSARHPLLFYTDADRQFDISELPYFVQMSHDADLLIGFRVYRYDTVLRSILSWIYNRLVGVLFRVRVRDVDCAFKLMRRDVADKLMLESDGFFIDTEIVARARKWNFRITQMGVRHYPRVAGQTTVRPSDIPLTLRTIARMWRRIYFPTRRHREEGERAQLTEDAIEVVPAASDRP